MGRSPFLYVRDQSGKLVSVQPERKKTSQGRIGESSKGKQTKKGKRSFPKRQERSFESKGVFFLDEINRAILESGVRTPKEAHEKLGILLNEAESRMRRDIPFRFEVKTFDEALEKYRRRLPMEI